MDRNAIIEEHYRRNYRRLCNIMVRRVGYSNAEDAVQEAYARALQYWEGAQPIENFGAWFMKVCFNAGNKIIRDTEASPFDGSETAAAFSVPSNAEEWYELGLLQEELNKEK